MNTSVKGVIESLVSLGTDYTDVTLETAANMVRIATDTPGSYVVFQNRHGHGPCIWRNTKDEIEKFVADILGGGTTGLSERHLYAFSVDGKDTVLALPVRTARGYITWVRRDAERFGGNPWSEYERN